MLANISKVKSSFDDILLQADLGVIDVAWEKKEVSSSKLKKYTSQMAEEIRQLYMNLENIE